MEMLLKIADSIALDSLQYGSLVWKGTRDWKFTVKLSYQILVRSMTGIYGSSVEWPWKMIWKTKAPVKVPCFGWVAAHEAC